jgi:hypothetical protein
MNDFQPTPDLLDNFNVIDVVAHSISSQFAYNSKELAQRQARAAIDKLCDILEAAMNNPKDPLFLMAPLWSTACASLPVHRLNTFQFDPCPAHAVLVSAPLAAFASSCKSSAKVAPHHVLLAQFNAAQSTTHGNVGSGMNVRFNCSKS